MGLAERQKPNATYDDAHEPGRGRRAEKPSDVPPRGWLDILSRTAKRISVDNITVVAAGVAFYAFVAVVPALAATIGIYGLISNPAEVGGQITSFARVLPREVLPLLEQQMKRITSNTDAAGISAIIGLLIAIYSSAGATKALIQGLNIAYGEQEKRGFFKLNLVALVLTFGAIIGAIVAIALVAVLPAVLEHLSFGVAIDNVLNWARWPILVGGFVAGLSVVYRYGPSRDDAKWRWVSWGAAAAALLWLAASGLFSLYVAKFSSYDKTYGSLGAVVVFLMWLWLSALAVLVGAELNSEMERQTLRDTTTGPEKPLGQRGAQSADTVGPARHRDPDKEKNRPPRPPTPGQDRRPDVGTEISPVGHGAVTHGGLEGGTRCPHRVFGLSQNSPMRTSGSTSFARVERQCGATAFATDLWLRVGRLHLAARGAEDFDHRMHGGLGINAGRTNPGDHERHELHESLTRTPAHRAHRPAARNPSRFRSPVSGLLPPPHQPV